MAEHPDPTTTTENQHSHSDNWSGAEAVMDDADEQRVLFGTFDSFYQYAKVAHYNTTHTRRQAFYAMPQAHWQLLAAPPFSYLDTLNSVDDAIDENAGLAKAILDTGLETFGAQYSMSDEEFAKKWRSTATQNDLEKARSTVRQFYRDWSAEGAVEREACYGPIIKDLQDERQLQNFDSMRVLVPGAGLGRLVFELCNDGFDVEGNEISYHQLLASSYILNYCPGPRTHTIFPWIHGFSNHIRRSHQFRSVKVPDVHPGMELQARSQNTSKRPPGEMSMTASDFLLLYSDEAHKSKFDAIATVFFIDTAPNLIRYIETIKNCLRQGGLWVNLGPLLWHFDNNSSGKSEPSNEVGATPEDKGIADPGSVELTDDEVVMLIEKFGFVIEKRESKLNAGYIQDPESMLQSSLYQVSHWVARKL